MNVILKRLIPEDDKHTIIENKTRVEVIPDCLMTFKVPCYKKLSPCKILFRYLSRSITQDLDVFISLEDVQPDENKNDMKATMPQTMTVTQPKFKHF